MSALLALYRALGTAAGPALDVYLRRRAAEGREDPLRLDERRGLPSLPRPEGPLVWLHGASVGESVSALPLVAALREHPARPSMLVTSGTVTSARLMAERLPEGALHQFLPLDRPAWVRRFLDRWRPDLALWIESELWPALLAETQARDIPTGLINARISESSLRNWKRLPGLIAPLMARLDICLAQNETQVARLKALGAAQAICVGNLKGAGLPLPVDKHELAGHLAILGNRPRWVAASTHAGEETVAIAAHKALAEAHPGLLTVIVPRHPDRAEAVAEEIAGAGLTLVRRSKEELPRAETQIYLMDTLGEMGLAYRLSDITFVGGSLSGSGGHNLLEPAQLGRAILHGPDVRNTEDSAQALALAGARAQVDGPEALTRMLTRLLNDPEALADAQAAARAVADQMAEGLSAVMAQLRPLLDRLPQPDRTQEPAS